MTSNLDTTMHTRPKVRLERRGDITLLLIDNPPVNALSTEVVSELGVAVEAFGRDASSSALVIGCDGRTFVAGGDIACFDDPAFSAAPLNRILASIEGLDRPVVATMHGFAFGGGLELALACHWRVATADTQFAFPEVKLGLLPGSLGTQRLPRLIGPELAMDLISSGRSIDAPAALQCGLVDAVGDGDPLGRGVDFAREVLKSGKGARRTSDLSMDAARLPPDFFAAARHQASSKRAAYPAALAIVDAVEAAAGPFDEGEQVEARAFRALLDSPQSKAMRHLFFAQRQAAKIPGLSSALPRRPVRTVGVLGGGTMGRGIAINFLNAGLRVTLVETAEPALQAAVTGIRQVYKGNLAKGRITASEFEHRMALLHATVADSALGECDLVIEAVYEDRALKQAVCARLGSLCKPGAIIATNTSTLDVDELAAATGRPADVVGMHFFSPAHVMRLLEVVRGAATSPDVLLTVMKLAQRIGKVAVVSGACWGFIGNRMLEVYLRETEFLLLEGATPAQVDDAMEEIGMAMGPCRMLDMAGIDVGAQVVIEQAKAGRVPADDSYRVVVRRLFERGRIGQKAGRGYYAYEGRRAIEDPAVLEITRELAREHGVAPRPSIDRQEIVERLLYPLINEGARILDEGIAYRASDIDVVWTSGYGFPDHLGGPMFHADSVGLRHILDRLAHHARVRGNPHGYWTPSTLLEKLAESGRRFQDQTPE